MTFKFFYNSALRLMAVMAVLATAGCSSLHSDRGLLQPSGPGAGGTAQQEYRLQPGDQVSLQIYREPQLSGEFRLDENGLIRHPLCGAVQAGGLTAAEVEARVTELLGDRYLVNPKVIATISSAQSSQVVILGEVKNPGIRKIPFGETVTLLQAVALAGGFTDLASVDRVSVVRRTDGKETSVRVRVSRVISGKDPDPVLEPNDVIMVPQIVF